jgi:RHS repeat-associated protein
VGGRTRRPRGSLAVSISALLIFQAGAVAPASSFAAKQTDASESTPPVVDAARTPGEQPDLRTAASRTTYKRDGTFTAELFTGPVHYRDGRGAWLPIDSTLVEDSGGYAWRNAGNAFGARFKEELGEDAVRFEVAGEAFTLTLENANRKGASARGAKLSYADALPAVDLEYELLPEGVKETLVLANAEAPTQFRFRLEGIGRADLKAEELPDGSIAVQAAGVPGTAFMLAAPYALDAADDQTIIPLDEPNATLEASQQDGDLLLDLRLDAQWLRDPARRFPVRLDPTITIQPSVEDASFVVDGGSWISDRLFIGGTDCCGIYRGALLFELGAIPGGVTVTDAQLQLLYDGWCIDVTNPPGGHCGGSGYQIDLHRMTAAWTTDTPTNSLAFEATAAATHTFTRTEGWMDWNVTGLVSNWVAGTQPNFGVLIKRLDEVVGNSGPTPPGRRYTGESTQRPKLMVTYVSDAVTVAQPTTLHADGAELSWTAYAPPSGAPFQRYEIHRSSEQVFAPSASTLLATITDPNVTAFRDTTARAQASFTYRVVANSSPSNLVTVTLPAAGRSTIFVQPGPADGKATWLFLWRAFAYCDGHGADETLWVGSHENAVHRPILEFDVRDIPAGSLVESATLSLWHGFQFNQTMTVDVHRVTRAWTEGAVNGCNGQGADWYETVGGAPWATAGGDFDPQIYASAVAPNGEDPSWDDFGVTSLVQSWVSGEAPNLGFLLKGRTEPATPGFAFDYNADDHAVSPTLRPKLAVTYVDGSQAQGPHVVISAPAGGGQVGGNAVTIAADASDDRRVDLVEFLLDGAVIGSDSTAPYSLTWNSTTTTSGSHTLAGRATDDAGNVTTSPGNAISVDNSAPPTTSLTAPANNATVSGTAVTVSATAADDGGVTMVEFYVDDTRIGEDATSPYSISWNTLNPDLPFYDSARVVTSRAYDAGGKVTASAARTVTVSNRTGIYKATFALVAPSVLPPSMVYDPAGPQANAGVNIKITNNSTSTWSASSVFLRYRWFGPNHTVQNPDVIAGPNVSLGQNALKNKFVTLNGVIIPPPALPDGADRAQYRLVLDLYDTSGATYFAAKGNQPLEHPILVNKVLRTKLGLERFHNYWGTDLGAGTGNLVNVANGNNLLRWTPFLAPGRGLSTVVDLTYSSLENKSETPAGNNWSLSISGLTRLGARLDVHPNNADTIAGNAKKWIAFVDGDGSTHRFEGITVGGTQVWDAPSGVHLYLREYSTTDPARKWALTRPDRVTFFFDTEGYPTSVVDLNGNELRFTLSTVAPGDDPGGANKRVTAVTDAAGVADGAPNRTFTIAYYTKLEAKKPQVRGRVRTITDHTGSELAFDYYDDGNLRRLVQRGGTNADGTALADRVFVFTYTTSDGSGPAIPNAADRVNPDPKTNQSTRVFSVRDPRGVESTFTYFGPTSGQLRWKLSGLTDRAGQTTTFAYDLTSRITTITAPLSRVTRYGYDIDGKVTSITDPLDRVTTVGWTTDFHVASVDEPGDGLMEFTYNGNGYLLDRKVKTGVDGSSNPIWSHTQLAYENVAVDTNDVSGKWEPGRSIPHVSQLSSRTDPNGMATATPTDDYRWLFDYDAEGNLLTVTDPADFDTGYAWYANGTLQTATDANQRVTTFNTYDPSGQPTKITDAAAGVTQFGYDADGLLLWVQDANHASNTGGDPRSYRSYLDYDSFHRLGRQSTPKSTTLEQGVLIWSAGAFDANDNVVREVGPHFGTGYTGTGAITTHGYDPMDRETLTTGPDTTVDPAGERVAMAYDGAGRLTSLTLPKGVATTGTANDFATFYVYDALDRVARQTRHLTDAGGAILSSLHTHACYDVSGDLVQVTSPRANLATVNCGSPVEANSTTFEYDDAHRRTAVIDPLAHRAETAYDSNGNVSSTMDAAGNATTVTYDERNLAIRSVAPFTTGTGARPITTVIEYDPVGNRSRLISPRAFDVANGGPTFSQYVTAYVYDALNRLTRVDLPTDTVYPTQYYVHNAYDAVGNLLWNSLPVTAASPGSVAETSKNQLTYWDPGWIASSDTPDTTPRAHFDYTAEGWQRLRTPEAAGGGLNLAEQQIWSHYVDGMLRERRDRGGQLTSYVYDANNNLATALDAAGITADDRSPMDVQATWDSLDRLAKVRSKEEDSANYRFTTYAYDLNANVTRRDDDGEETPAGSLVTAGRRNDYSYDGADWLTTQLDYGTSSGASDDQRITNAFFPTGWEQSRVVARNNGSGTWVTKQTTDWTHYLNGQLKTLVTKNGAGTTVESHTVEYLDSADDYVNGHRTKDVFTQQGPDTAAPCRIAACTATYLFDPRDKLVREVNGHGATTDYTLDPSGNITRELVTGDGAKDVTYAYTGTQLTTVTTGGATQKYWYDPTGNLDCVTLASGSQANCAVGSGGTYSAQVLADYSYDYLDRMTQHRSFATDGTTSTKDDAADYEYDALDRVLEQTESHGATGSPRTTLMTYLGLGVQVSTETQHNGDDGSDPLLTTKNYAYDAYGHRISMTNAPTGGTATTSTYGYDVHGSVSLLLADTGTATASYGYRAYGGADDELTAGDFDPSDRSESAGLLDNPLNAFRYSGRRLDSGSGSIDMGARRFGPDTARFLQRDFFNGALSDLGLALDPLTQNRYALASGNPISFVEWDGHRMLVDGGGGSGTAGGTAIVAGTVVNIDQDLRVESGGSPGLDLGDVGGVLVGAGEGAVETIGGLFDAGAWLLRTANPFDDSQRRENQRAIEQLWANKEQVPGAVWSGITTPIAEDWQAGNEGEAIGRSIFLIGEVVVGTKGATKAIRGVRSADDLAAAGIPVAQDLSLSRTVAHHLDEVSRAGIPARPYLRSRLLVQEIMRAANPVADPGGIPGGLRWDVPGSFNGSVGTWQLVVNPSTNSIVHFLFARTR